MNLVCLDVGTTTTRGWLVSSAGIVAHTRRAAGVRDTARTRSYTVVRDAIRQVCAEMQHVANERRLTVAGVAAAGMIGSALGLRDVPHMAAPAGADALRSAVAVMEDADLTDLPLAIVPGVRTVARGDSPGDVMRGEETLCTGLLSLGIIQSPALVLNLGSHWKLIAIDRAGQIAWSETTLAGELIHATWRDTLLADSLPQDGPDRFDDATVERGAQFAREHGLARALFAVRLHAQNNGLSPNERLAWLYGTYIAHDLDPWRRRGALSSTVALVGAPAVTAAWSAQLLAAGYATFPVSTADSERALVAGLGLLTIEAFGAAGAPR